VIEPLGAALYLMFSLAVRPHRSGVRGEYLSIRGLVFDDLHRICSGDEPQRRFVLRCQLHDGKAELVRITDLSVIARFEQR